MKNNSSKRYTIFIDESGDHTYNKLDETGRRFLALVGIVMENDYYYNVFCPNLQNLKNKFFVYEPDKVVLHRTEIINKKGAYKILQDEKIRKAFDEEIINLISGSIYNIIGVVIDKKSHIERYSKPFHPYHYCLKILLERYRGFLSYNKSVGDILVESRDSVQDRQLQAEYEEIFNNGTGYLKAQDFKDCFTSGKLKFKKKSANICGLELADILAYSVKDDILIENKQIELKVNFGSKFIEALRIKYCYKGKIII